MAPTPPPPGYANDNRPTFFLVFCFPFVFLDSVRVHVLGVAAYTDHVC